MKGTAENRTPAGGWEFARTISLVLTILLVCLPNALLSGQEPPKISVETNMVTVFASVRDKHSQIVSNLTKDDFTVDEDGRPQAITYFARENDLALTVGLLVDTSLSQRRVLDKERSASSSFVDHTLREDKKDQAFLINFDHDVTLLEDLTTSRKKLESALDSLQTPQMEDASSNGGHRRGGGGGGGTLLYDAVYLASNELMKKQQGRKALIVLTDGDDRGSKETLATAIQSAERANTIVYAILFKDEEGYGNGGYGGGHMGGGGMGGGGMGGGGHRRYPQESRPDGKKVLQQMSKETGGRFFEVTKKETIDQIYSEIDEELRNQYALGYTPAKTDADVGYHKIQLTTKQKDATVQTREGFYVDR